MLLVSGVSAEYISGDTASDVSFSEAESYMSSCDIVSSNYPDSEVSDTPQIDDSIDNGDFDKEIENDYCLCCVDQSNDGLISAIEVCNVSSFNGSYSTGCDEIVSTVKVGDDLLTSVELNGSFAHLTDVDDSENILDTLGISAQDYLTQYDNFEYNNSILADVNTDIETSDSYRLGKYLMRVASDLLDFESADDVLLITTAGISKLNGETSEPVIEGIIDESGELISYGKGNLLMLQNSNDSLDFCFVVKKGTALNAAVFLNGSYQKVYSGTISEGMSSSQWQTYYNSVGAEDALSFASLANAWNDGIPFELLQEAAFHGQIGEGNIYGYAITNLLLQYYPPIEENSAGNHSQEISQYTVLSIPGNSATDTVMYFLDETSGKSSYVGFNTVSTGATKEMVGIIRWNGQTNKGNIIVMEYDSDANKKLFKKETGITVKDGLSKLRHVNWLFNRANDNPESLISILVEKRDLSEEQYLYLVGSNDAKDENGHVNSHGLDYAYIKSLNLPDAVRSNAIGQKGTLDYEDFINIGSKAAENAKAIYENELGIQLNDSSDVMVLTSAGYVLLNGQSTEGCWEGLYDVLRTRLSRGTLLPVHQAIWNPLWFNFILKQSDGSLMSIYMRYNEENGSFFISDYNGTQTYNLNISTLNNSALSSGIRESAYPDGNFYGIESISNAWSDGIAFDQLMAVLYHGSACESLFPGFFMADYILENFPLDKNQHYVYVANNVGCKDDSLEFALDLYPGLGNYLVQRLTSDEYKGKNGLDEQGILIVWDSADKIGQAVAINYQWPDVDLSNYATSESKSAALVKAFIEQSKGESNPLVESQKITFSDEKWITKSQAKKIKAGGKGSSLKYLRSLGYISKEDFLKAIAAKNADKKKKDNTNKPNKDEKDTKHDKQNWGSHGYHHSTGYSTSNRLDGVSEGDGMLDNSTKKGNVTATMINDNGPFEIPQLKTPTNFNTLIISIMGVFVMGILFGISHRRQEN